MNEPKCSRPARGLALLALSGLTSLLGAGLPPEQPLWPEGVPPGPIHYERAEGLRTNAASPTSPSGSNRVFSFVGTPTYTIHAAPAASANGVGLVIYPGGGYRDVWMDREGNDLALWLKERGVTSLVLKYRTDTPGADGKLPASLEDYLPAVFADGREAIRVLRSKAAELHLDPRKIGAAGFSAGGNLAFNMVFRPEADRKPGAVSGEPDFAGLFYPWLRDDFTAAVAEARRIPPIFIINAADDKLTPVKPCVEFYQCLLKAGGKAEFHVFSQGGHGFDLGEGHGQSPPRWKESFVAWLKDAGFIQP